jgi:S-adenosylmethionine:tRNA ribosyltransferase-isomerase
MRGEIPDPALFATGHYDYFLPEELIARYPAEPRDSARLLQLNPEDGSLKDRIFRDIIELLHPGDALVINDTRVIPARLLGHKLSGGQAELLLLEPHASGGWKALARPAKRLPAGTVLRLSSPGRAEVSVRIEEVLQDMPGGRRICFLETENETALIEAYGQMPLPPYLRREAGEQDKQDYQTVYARYNGSVAAPTAGLHFTPELLAQLTQQGVILVPLTLHVGLGTFRPVAAADIRAHHMHREVYNLGAEAAEQLNEVRRAGGRIVAVGTTAVRTLETVYREETGFQAAAGETDIFIYPGYTYRAVDALITNFHLPQSTLLMLVAALAGFDQTLRAYRYAVEQGYRFYSYGDAMYIGT